MTSEKSTKNYFFWCAQNHELKLTTCVFIIPIRTIYVGVTHIFKWYALFFSFALIVSVWATECCKEYNQTHEQRSIRRETNTHKVPICLFTQVCAKVWSLFICDHCSPVAIDLGWTLQRIFVNGNCVNKIMTQEQFNNMTRIIIL